MKRLILISLLFAISFLSFATPIQSALVGTNDQAALNGSNKKLLTPQPLLSEQKGLILLDYETIPVVNDVPLDLLGFHYLNQIRDWMYIGIGGYAPLVQGAYGGFMALDAMLLLQKKIFANLFLDAGIGLGGGGGGRSIRHSMVLAEEGGLFRAYAGLGYDFNAFAAGLNYSQFRFTISAIDHSQLDFFVQVPVSNFVGPYG